MKSNAVKVAHLSHNMSSILGRTVILEGIKAGTVQTADIVAALVEDNQPRQYRKPVVVPGLRGKETRFDSVRFAAAHLLWIENRKGIIPTGTYYARALNAIEKRIARYCNADNVPGYYWAE